MQPPPTPMREEFGLFEVKSIPSGSEVFLNNSFIGMTPITAQRIRSGFYFLEVRKRGFKPWKKEIRIDPKAKNEYYPILEEQ